MPRTPSSVYRPQPARPQMSGPNRAPESRAESEGGDTMQNPNAEPYEPPTLTHVGDLASLTKGTAHEKNSDDNDGSSYYDKS